MQGMTNAVNSGLVYYLGTGTSFDVSSIAEYKNFTTDNFIVGSTSFKADCGNGNSDGPNLGGGVGTSGSISKSYNSSSGVLTVSGGGGSNSTDGGKLSINGSLGTCFAYLIIGKIKTI